MATLIYTGDEEKCKQINYVECPACSDRFEVTEGTYLDSVTLDDCVLVCRKHKTLNVADEIKIQDSLQRALKHKRGRVHKDGAMLKRSEILEQMDYKIKGDW